MQVSVFQRLTHLLAQLARFLGGGLRALFGTTTVTSTVVPDRNGGGEPVATGGGGTGARGAKPDAAAATTRGAAPRAADPGLVAKAAGSSGSDAAAPSSAAPGSPGAGPATTDAEAPPPPPKNEPPPRITILDVRPQIDVGRFDLKRTVGETVEASAEVFRDGHDVIRAVLRHRPPGGDWVETTMTWIDREVDGDRWVASFVPDQEGTWTYEVGAFTDHFATWHDEVSRKRLAGGEDLSSEVEEGAELLREAEPLADLIDGQRIAAALAVVADPTADLEAKLDATLAPRLLEAVERNPARRDFVTASPLAVAVERERARFSAWYELFPRSWGGFDGVRAELPKLAELGFDVLYMPPIHPIGLKNRKGPNNTLTAGPDDPGSPYAIGSELGGHEAIAPELGDLASFEALVEAAHANGMELALDLALNCSADHPWLKEHPEWFNHRPDGTLKYAENPPKKYQDIYNLNFDSEDWKGLWEALRDMVVLWVERGVRVFRVDNPHTKPLPFWEWLIAEVRATHPDVIFLAEAFTRRAKLTTLAKLGFSQSYTYFTWKNASWELSRYVEELAYVDGDYTRPNFFTNTPDILTEYLVDGGPPAFEARLVLAATLSPSYGIYSGFESFENTPVKPGSEEYMDSEKYQLRERSLDGPLLPMIGRLNAARHANPALQYLSNISFLDTENEGLIAYAKRTGDNTVICVVNVDPHNAQEGVVNVPAWLGTPPAFRVRDLLDDEAYDWSIGHNYVRLAPGERMAHVMRVER